MLNSWVKRRKISSLLCSFLFILANPGSLFWDGTVIYVEGSQTLEVPLFVALNRFVL